MQKKYIVRLSDEERGSLNEVIKKLKGSGQKVRRAQVLLKADAEGPSWTESRRRLVAAPKRSRTFARAWLSAGLRRRCTASSGSSRPPRSCSTENKKPR